MWITMLTFRRVLLCQMAVNLTYQVAKASLCFGGRDIYATVKENSPAGEFVADLGIAGDPGASSIRLCLAGKNADWFYLEGRTIRLNSSFSRVLDREVQGSILFAALMCFEDDLIQSEYRILVEVLNENDNRPGFMEQTVQPFYINELTAVNSAVFTVKAFDADGDTITYVIDRTSPDASFFRIDLPNSGKVILDKPLDYETKTQLQFVMYAVETKTREKYNTTATLTVNVLDGDDQYPQFKPCAPRTPDQNHMVCTSPVYMVNITEEDQDIILDFSPGPILAEDGDRAINSPVLYTILSGADQGRFLIDNKTGEVSIARRVENRQLTPTFRLRILAYQTNDPNKYSVATAVVKVLAENRFPPHFNRTTYKGFVMESASPAMLVSSYGHQVLGIQAVDLDYIDGLNPKIHYSLEPQTSTTRLYHITQDGFLIAKTNLLRAFDRHILEVVATDQESGEVAKASVDIEVLQKGQPVPRSPFAEERLFGDMDVGKAGGIVAILLLLVVTALFLLVRLVRRQRSQRDPAILSSVALGKHPNVSLRWFQQQVNSGRPMPLIEEVSYHNEAFSGDYEGSGSLHGRHGTYVIKENRPVAPVPQPFSRSLDATNQLNEGFPILVIPEPVPRTLRLSNMFKKKSLDQPLDKPACPKESLAWKERMVTIVSRDYPWSEGAQIEDTEGVIITFNRDQSESLDDLGEHADQGQTESRRTSDNMLPVGRRGPEEAKRRSVQATAAAGRKSEERGNTGQSSVPIICFTDGDNVCQEEGPGNQGGRLAGYKEGGNEWQPEDPPSKTKEPQSQESNTSRGGLMYFVEDSMEF